MSVPELLALIHRVNPTGLELPPAEAEQRYRLKSALQSRLVRDHAPDLEFVPDPDRPGVVSVRHRYSPGDACHAVVAELDVDARSVVQLQLDLGPDLPELGPQAVAGGPSKPAAPHSDDAPGLVRRAAAALAEYDYDAARDLVERAFGLDRGGAVALPFLELLVDHLAADHEAIALASSLTAEVAAQPEIRGLAALASARAGDRPAARLWLRGTRGARGALGAAALAAAVVSLALLGAAWWWGLVGAAVAAAAAVARRALAR